MPKLKNQFPKKCRDRNQCFSWHNGKRYYHGVWNSSEADKSYKRFIAALLENPYLPLQDNKTGDVLVSELAAGFLDCVEAQTDRTDFLHFRRAVGFLVEIYGELSVNEFSPKKLRVCQSQMVEAGTGRAFFYSCPSKLCKCKKLLVVGRKSGQSKVHALPQCVRPFSRSP